MAETLDRLSRDPEDLVGLFKRCQFAGIRIYTLAEGFITELHVGLKGTMSAFSRTSPTKPVAGCSGAWRPAPLQAA